MVVDINKDLLEIKKIESEQSERNHREDTFVPMIHIMPPAGWMNDPNGLCQLNGIHHIFFQYSPYEAKGGDKYWGHYETKDFIHYTYTGIFLLPDSPEDKDGAFSGSCLIEDGKMYIYYTGNVMEEGDYDYTYNGRGANTILVTSKDGITASKKQVLLTSDDYPDRLSCHVRDPKVWKQGDKYYMVLGARTMDDKGTVLLYESDEKLDWNFVRYIETEDKYGYMWECPDLFKLNGKDILSISPQGLDSEEFRYQNECQSGYFICGDEYNVTPMSFVEWDMGFDFYAPQTYLDEKGRRILIGWMGVSGASYDYDPSIEKGWQHMLCLPRELTYDSDLNLIRQNPVEELLLLRDEMINSFSQFEEDVNLASLPRAYELVLDDIDADADFQLVLDENLKLNYDSKQMILTLQFIDNGYGRDNRNIKMKQGLSNLRIFVDTCCAEIFINQGMYAMTTKYFYKKSVETVEVSTSVEANRSLVAKGKYSRLDVYSLKAFEFKM